MEENWALDGLQLAGPKVMVGMEVLTGKLLTPGFLSAAHSSKGTALNDLEYDRGVTEY